MKTLLYLVICLALTVPAVAQTLSGRVYEGATGTEPPNSSYLQNVTVQLWGSNNQGNLDSKLDETTTDANGWYSVSTRAIWEFYYIKEIDPSGYTSNGATTVGGTVINANLIEYAYPISGKTTTGNKFWDSPPAPRNNPPVADCNGPYHGYVGQPVTLDGTGSYDPDVGDSITKYEWDLDKDHVYDDASGATPQKTYNTAGWYSVALRVYDTHNAVSGRDSTYIQIEELQEEYGLIKGFKFYDLSQNGQRDAGEHGLPGWQIYLDLDNDGQYDHNTMTDSTGGYAFSNVPPGTHRVYEGVQTGWTQSYPANGYHLVTVTAGGVYDDLDFGNYRGASEYEFDYGDVPAPPFDASWHRALHQTFYLGNIIDADAAHQSDANAMGDDSDGSDDEDGVNVTSALIPGLNATVDVTMMVQGIDEPWLRIWIDFNQNDVWDNSEIIVDTIATTGTFTFPFLVPGTALTGTTFMRAMLTDMGPVNMSGIPYGEIEDYEIDIGRSGSITIVKMAMPADDTPFSFSGDLGAFTLSDPSAPTYTVYSIPPGSYVVKENIPSGWTLVNLGISGDTGTMSSIDLNAATVTINYDAGENITVFFENIYEVEEGLDFGDAPDSYRTVLANTGAAHTIDPDISIGKYTDAEADGQPSMGANEDDLNGTPDDEDGVQLPGLLTPGAATSAQIEIENRGSADEYAHIAGWIDFNLDGQFQLSENIGVQYLTLTPGMNNYTMNFNVPSASMVGQTYARFRLYIGRLPQGAVFAAIPWDFGSDGEVEDYVVQIGETEDTDFGDAPNPYPSASHTIQGAWMGNPTQPPDSDPGMQRHPQALGDDLDADGDDEDGFSVIGNWVPGQGTQIMLFLAIPAGEKGSACVWIDWNQNGNWNDPNEKVMWADFDNSAGQNISPYLAYIGTTVMVPSTIQPDSTYARARIARVGHSNLSPFGHYMAGEVEDYRLLIEPDGDEWPEEFIVFGYKWNDLNANGVWDMAPTPEPPLPNWPIWLDLNGNGVQDASDLMTYTDASGRYEFNHLPAGTYIVGEDILPGWVQSYPSAPGTHSVILGSNQLIQAANFGNYEDEPGPGKDVMKWSQPPLFDPMMEDTTCYFGWDEISIFHDKIAADDWFCFNPQPVTGIRWWGSFEGWQEEMAPDIAPDEFHIGIWTDVPRDENNEWSHPGELVWEAWVPREAVHEKMVRCVFFPDRMDQPETCFMYEWQIPKSHWFYQEGDSTVYWLSVAAAYPPDMNIEHPWGWKTRLHYFNDDAVNMFFPEPVEVGKMFQEGGPIQPQWDLAFELFTTEYEWNLDYGDAPNPGFLTLRHCNGAHHLVDDNIKLGKLVDIDYDGHPSGMADGDDADVSNDEDGVHQVDDIVAGEMAKFEIELSHDGFVNVWLDVDRTGHWFEEHNHVVDDLWLPAGNHGFDFMVPDDAEPGEAMMRVRFSTQPGLWFCGFAIDGEVEDYLVDITTGVEDRSGALPTEFKLAPNIPNPFNPTTLIRYELPTTCQVQLSIYNVNGQIVATLVNDQQSAGYYEKLWNASDMPSGIYLVELTAGTFRKAQKISLVK